VKAGEKIASVYKYMITSVSQPCPKQQHEYSSWRLPVILVTRLFQSSAEQICITAGVVVSREPLHMITHAQ